MPLNIRSEEVNRLAEKVVALAKVSKTEAVRIALVKEVERLERVPSLLERMRPARQRIATHPDTGLEADKSSSTRSTANPDVRRCIGDGRDPRAREEENFVLFRCLVAAHQPITSALAIFEAASAICRKKSVSVEMAEAEVRGLLEHARIRVVAMIDTEAHGALAAMPDTERGEATRLNSI